LRKSPAYIFTAHVLTFAALLAWSWRKWPDPLVDFGRELYFAWQINEGRLLYRDLASLFGPVSPYINALWFRLFGTSLLTLALCNTAIFAATIAGIYHLVRIPTDRATATAASTSAKGDIPVDKNMACPKLDTNSSKGRLLRSREAILNASTPNSCNNRALGKSQAVAR